MRRALALAALVAISAAGGAQERPTVLQLPAGARALGIGDAFVAGRSPEVIFYNPAQLVLQPGVAVSAQRFGRSAGALSMAAVSPLPGGAIGIGIQFIEFRDNPPGVGSPGGIFTSGGSAIASSLAASLALNLPAIKTIRSGITAKMAHEQVGAGRDEVIAVDVGLARDFFGRATLGFAAQNLGPALRLNGEDAKLPARYTLGASAQAPPVATFFDVAASASVSYLRDGTIVPAGGVEASYVPLDGWAFTGRIGMRDVDERSGAGALTFGGGLSLDRVSLDYGFHTMEGGGASHRVGLRVR